MGVPFGALDPEEMRIADEYRHRPLRTTGEKVHGRRSPRWSGTRPAGTSTRSSRSRWPRSSGGELSERDPEPADARRAAADDRRRPRRGAADLRLRDARRAPPRLAVRDHRHVPVARVHAVLARRPDRRRGGAAHVLRPGRGVGLRPGHAAVERRPPVLVPDRARRPVRRAPGADARAGARRRLGRRALLVQRPPGAARRRGPLRGRGRGRRGVRAPLRPLPQPAGRALELAARRRARRARA